MVRNTYGVGVFTLLFGMGLAVVAGLATVQDDLALRRLVTVTGMKTAGRETAEYQVQGKWYQPNPYETELLNEQDGRKKNDVLLPLNIPVTLWVDPDNPHTALLLRVLPATDFLEAMVGMTLIALGVLLVGGRSTPPNREMRLGADARGMMELQARALWSVPPKMKIVAALAFAGGALGWGTYYALAARRYDGGERGFVPACAVCALAGLTWLGFSLRRDKGLGRPRLWIEAGALKRGKPFAARLEIRALREIMVFRAEIRLICAEHRWRRGGASGGGWEVIDDLWQSEPVVWQRDRLAKGDTATWEGTWVGTPEQAASGGSLQKQDKDGWPYCVWRLEVWGSNGYGEGTKTAFIVRMG